MLKIGEYLAKLQARPWLSRALGVPDHLTAMPPCNLSLIACFMSLHTVVWQVGYGLVVRFVVTIVYCKFTKASSSEKLVGLNRLRFDRIMAVSVWPHFLANPVM